MIRSAFYSLLLLPTIVSADTTLASVEDRNLRMVCESDDSNVHCTIRKRRLKVFNVFTLENPTRLVIDINRMPKGKSKFATSKSESALTQIRTGWHPEKYRIVLDINSALENYSWEKFGDVIQISFQPEPRKPEGLLAKNLLSDTPAAEQPRGRAPTLAVANKTTASEQIAPQDTPPLKVEDTTAQAPVVRAQLKPAEDSFNRGVQVVQKGRFGIEPSDTSTTESVELPITNPPTSALSTALTLIGKQNMPEQEKVTAATKIVRLRTDSEDRELNNLTPISPQVSTRQTPRNTLEAPKLAAAIKIQPVARPEVNHIASLSELPAENPFGDTPLKARIFQKSEPIENECESATENCTPHMFTTLTKEKKLAPVKTIKVMTSIVEQAPASLELAEQTLERSEVRDPTETAEPDIRLDLLAALNPEMPENILRKKTVPAATHSDAPGTEEQFLPDLNLITEPETARARMNPAMIPAQEPDEPKLQEGQFLQGITFNYTESEGTITEPSIFIGLTEKPHFNLSKVGPRTYRLRVMKGQVTNESLLLPFFPPHTFPRISFVQAKNETNRVTVTIGVERGSRLMAISKADGIQINVLE